MPRTIEEAKKIGEAKGWCLNPDKKAVENIIKAMNNKKEKFGEYYCPCRLQKIPENICPCKWAPDEIEKDGHCHCLLYYKCG
jgi:ferredoxin-thioredoxin reductase catalytic subunit